MVHVISRCTLHGYHKSREFMNRSVEIFHDHTLLVLC